MPWMAWPRSWLAGRAQLRAVELSREMATMPTPLTPREPTRAQLLIQCGRYIGGIAILLVAVVLFKLRLLRASHATARLGERVGGGSPVFS